MLCPLHVNMCACVHVSIICEYVHVSIMCEYACMCGCVHHVCICASVCIYHIECMYVCVECVCAHMSVSLGIHAYIYPMYIHCMENPFTANLFAIQCMQLRMYVHIMNVIYLYVYMFSCTYVCLYIMYLCM